MSSPDGVKTTDLSQDARTIAAGFWSLDGVMTELTFARAHIIHPRARAALDELTAAGFLFRRDKRKGSATWKPTSTMHPFARTLPRPTDADSFPMTRE